MVQPNDSVPEAHNYAALEALILEKLALQLMTPTTLAADVPFSSLGVDSVGVVILVAELESTLDFVFNPEDLDMKYFSNAASLAALLGEKYHLTGPQA
ncbi:hypothetical protein Dd1591_3652 [Dickeya chrysanthemi Ech1591]|uniref:Carrier domain-containing protein n=1 Tax=Dickeya chrysanthemi (strain Ech1591) TaxID=561229 RepID=C6CLF7_DICC1|nr:acyl carrier protein [Dickeya chrysanthemi]ACT08460.1 hypothetical protein Dd1591_3652 [Dickeya chrysanthemi Ech1591]